MFADTEQWWTTLRAISVVNVLAWSAAALWMLRRRAAQPSDAWASRRLQLLLSAGYVFGCAYRSLMPVFDVQRLVLVDSWLSSAMVGRSVATLAELCFAAQWALLLREAADATADRFAATVARAVLPMIVAAEICSWYSVLTTSNLGHVIEESLWGLCAALLGLSLASMWPHLQPPRRPLVAFWCAAAALYVAYMFAVDVPMYWARWLADEAQGRTYLGVMQGAIDASTRWIVSHRWDDWKTETGWMTMYFSVAVWLSIALVCVPRLRATPAERYSGRTELSR